MGRGALGGSSANSRQARSRCRNKSDAARTAINRRSTIYEVSLAQAIGERLSMDCAALSVFSGASHSSGHEQAKRELGEKQATLQILKQRAEQIGNDYSRLRASSVEDLYQMLPRRNDDLVQARAVRELLAMERDSTSSQVRMYQQRNIDRN